MPSPLLSICGGQPVSSDDVTQKKVDTMKKITASNMQTMETTSFPLYLRTRVFCSSLFCFSLFCSSSSFLYLLYLIAEPSAQKNPTNENTVAAINNFVASGATINPLKSLRPQKNKMIETAAQIIDAPKRISTTK